MNWVLFSIALGTFVLAFASPMLVRPFLVLMGSWDVPNERSSHSKPTVRGLGIVPAMALLAAICAAALVADVDNEMLGPVALAALACSVLGLFEDLSGLSVTARVVLQLCIGGVVTILVRQITDFDLWILIFGPIVFAAYINISNFMDGINGISSLHGLVVGSTYSLIGMIADLEWLTFSGLVLSLVFLAFLPWNMMKGGAFLGDSGSYLLGGTVAALGIGAVVSGVEPIVVIGPLVVYLSDTGFTLLRRILRGDRWFEAHREHTYQRMAKHPSQHLPVATYVACLSGVGSAISLLVHMGELSYMGGSMALGVLAVAYPAIPWLWAQTRKFRLAGKH